MAYTYASNLNGTYETILESVQQIFSADADLFTGFSSNPSYLFADNLRQTMHNYAEFLEGALWLYGAVIVGNDLSEIEAVSLPLSTQDANYLSTRTNGFDTAINYLTTNLKMQPAPLANLTMSGPLIGDPGFETYFSQLNAEVAPSNLLSVQEGTLTDFANAPLSGATLTWVSPNFGTLPFGTGNGIAQVFQLPPEFTFPSIVPVAGVYKSDWQGNQLQYSTPRTNLLLYSQAIGGTDWGTFAATATLNNAVGPSGATTATLLTDDTTLNNHDVIQNIITVAGNSYVFSVDVKAGTLPHVLLLAFQTAWWGYVEFDVSAGAYFAQSGVGNPTFTYGISPLPNGYYRCWMSFPITSASAGTCTLEILESTATGGGHYTGTGTGTIYVDNAQCTVGTIPSSYIATTSTTATVTDYNLTSSILTFSTAPEVNASLTWQDASSNIFNFGVGNGSTTVYNLGVEYNPGPSIYKSDWQGNQLQYSTPRTNLGTYSQALSNWFASNVTVTDNAAVAPDGTTTASKLLATAVGGLIVGGIGAVIAETNYSSSAYFKEGTSTASSMQIWTDDNAHILGILSFTWTAGVPGGFVPSGGVSNVVSTAIGNGWYRISFEFNSGAYTSIESRISPDTNVGSNYLYVWGAQIEASQNPTSYIPTTTAPVTVTDYSLESSLGAYGISQDETNGWARIRAALLVSGASYPPNLADTLTFMQNIQQKVTNYGVTYAPTLSNNFPVSAIWNYAICVWTYQDMAAIYSNLPDSQVIQNIQILRYVLKQVELQCAELLTAYRTQAQIPPNTSPLLQSDSLMDLANRALGDYTQWVNIATANGLLPPYTYPTPAPNIASPGTQLFMPGSSTPTNLGNYLLNFLGTDLNWGIPLQSMPVWTGDFETVVGYTNLRWALARRILTPLNSLIYHPEYGSYLSQYLGQPLTNLNLQLMLSYTSIALLNDPRIASIVNLTPALTEVNTLLIQASVQPLGIGVTPTQINLTLQPSAISVT